MKVETQWLIDYYQKQLDEASNGYEIDYFREILHKLRNGYEMKWVKESDSLLGENLKVVVKKGKHVIIKNEKNNKEKKEIK